MTRRFWLFGATESPVVISERLAQALEMDLHLHESGYRGGEYFRGEGPTAQEVIIQLNFEDEEGYLAEAEFPAVSTLVYITQSIDDRRLDSLAAEGLEILRLEEL